MAPLALCFHSTAFAACSDTAIDLNATGIDSFLPGPRDADTDYNIESPCTIRVDANSWVETQETLTIADDSVLRFTFTSHDQGELQGIGFLTKEEASNAQLELAPKFFALYGTDRNFGSREYLYTQEGEKQHFEIPVGQFAGEKKIIFVTDNDVAKVGDSLFEDIRLVSCNDNAINFDDIQLQGFHPGQRDMDTKFSPDACKLTVDANSWIETAVEYDIQEDTVLSFTFKSRDEGQLHGIGFLSEEDELKENLNEFFFDIYGHEGNTSPFGYKYYRYTKTNGEEQKFEIPVGKYFSHLGKKKIVLMTDNDLPEGTGESVFENMVLSTPDQSETAKVFDNVIRQYLNENNNIPGMSVAVIKEGEFVYQKGFGLADKELGRPATPETVYLSASVSKLIAGVLALQLQEKSILDIGDKTSQYLDDMPNHHKETHDIGSLLSHGACIGHYGSWDGQYDATKYGIPDTDGRNHYDNAQLAAKSIYDYPFIVFKDGDPCVPLTGHRASYSSPAYILAAAAMEVAYNNHNPEEEPITINELLDQEILHAYDSMNVQFADAQLPDISPLHRAKPYTNNNTATNYKNNSWKTLGAGIESNVVDIAQFGWDVLDGKFLNDDLRDTLWSSYSSGYGLGWKIAKDQIDEETDVLIEHGYVGWNGQTTGARSSLRVYRDEGIVIAIMSNRSGHEITELARDLGFAALERL